ncbi:MAG: carbohydrate ABC transporter permease [Fimbriimonadaceae bacterium]|nr:carbohydrate ABC transporter permease [Fimbriimonadaceae bacterium]
MMRATNRVFTYVGLGLLAAFLLFPFAWMVLVSLRESKSPLPPMGELLQGATHWDNYGLVLFRTPLPVMRFFFNSVLVALVVVGGQVLVSAMAGFGLARYRFPGRDSVFALFMGSMMFAGAVTQIPVFLMLRNWGWLDTYAALIVPALSSSFNVFLLRQFFLAIPREIEEAAYLDGAGDWTIFSRLFLPMSKPALATVASFTFIATWTDFFWPLMATQSQSMRTLEVGLSIFQAGYQGSNWPLQMTAAVITLLPVLVVFLLLQKSFVRGVTLGALK